MLHHYIKGKEFLNFCININIFLTSTTTHWYCQLQCLYPVWLYANIFGSDLHRRFWIPKKKTSIHIQYKFSDVTENALCWIYSKSEKHEYMCRIINIIGNTMKTWNLKLKHCRFCCCCWTINPAALHAVNINGLGSQFSHVVFRIKAYTAESIHSASMLMLNNKKKRIPCVRWWRWVIVSVDIHICLVSIDAVFITRYTIFVSSWVLASQRSWFIERFNDILQ